MKVKFSTYPEGGHTRELVKKALLKLMAPVMGSAGELKISVHRESSRVCGTKRKRSHAGKVALVSRGPEHLGLCVQIGKKHKSICITGGATEVAAVANLFKRDGKWAPGTQQVINLLMPLANNKGHIPATEVARIISSVFGIKRSGAGPKILALKNAGILKALGDDKGNVVAYELMEDGVVEECTIPPKEAPASAATNEENELLRDIAMLTELADRLPSLQEKAAALQRELEDLEKELKRAQAAQQQLAQIRSIIKSP